MKMRKCILVWSGPPKQAGLGIGLVMKLDFETGFSTLAKYFVKGTILEIDSKCKIKQEVGEDDAHQEHQHLCNQG